MKKGWFAGCVLWAVWLLSACSNGAADRGTIHVTILHFNDVYEITPVRGGADGGLARVASLKKQLLARNPNTITVIGGDFFSPSAMGAAKVGGESLAGKQMVDVLNTLGVQYVTFGNHEFDLDKEQFYKRLQQTRFTWISSNVFDEKGRPYPGVKENLTVSFTSGETGEVFTIALFGLTLTANNPPYVSYTDPLTTAAQQVKQLEGKADFLIALTHQFIADDVATLQAQPQIDLVLGGHEHINYQRWRGNFTPILKADSNVRSVYVVDLFFDPSTRKTKVEPKLVPIDGTLAEDPEVKLVVDKWVRLVFDAFRRQGFDPEKVVTTISKPLDGRDADVRAHATNLTEIIARSMLRPYPEAELSIFNSGSIRIDDLLPAGKITVYDIIRVLPFGGLVQLAEIKGDLLKKILDQGLKNAGTGGNLQTANTRLSENGVWLINGAALNPARAYKVAINDFLLSGRQTNLNYLTPANPGIKLLNKGKGHDIRLLVIEQLKAEGGTP